MARLSHYIRNDVCEFTSLIPLRFSTRRSSNISQLSRLSTGNFIISSNKSSMCWLSWTASNRSSFCSTRPTVSRISNDFFNINRETFFSIEGSGVVIGFLNEDDVLQSTARRLLEPGEATTDCWSKEVVGVGDRLMTGSWWLKLRRGDSGVIPVGALQRLLFLVPSFCGL